MKKFVGLGYTKKAHGLKGAIKVNIYPHYIEDFLKAEIIFIEKNNQKVPFFIDDISGSKEMIIKLEDIEVKEDAKELLSKTIFLRVTDVLKEENREVVLEDTLKYLFCKGYQLKDTEKGLIGVIIDIIEFPKQEMALVHYNNSEIYIPLNEYLIQRVDRQKEVVIMILPEGLLELYD